jgi:branched-chain amino acid transport system permease protein
VTTVWVGLTLGAIYVVVATGYNIGLTVAGVLNFAQAEFLTLGAFLAYWVVVTLGWPFLAIILVAIPILGATGAVEQLLAIRPLAGKGLHGELVTTVGFATILDGIAVLIWGQDPLRVPFFGPQGVLHIVGGVVRPLDLMMIGGAVALVLIFHLWTHHTRLGLASLAASEDRESAKLLGVNVQLLSAGSFAVAAAIGGLFAPVIGPETYAVVTVSAALAVKGFVALAIGGFGSQLGALVGGLTVGLTEALAARWLGSNYSLLAVFVLLIVLLLGRPQGLFGKPSDRSV